MAGLLKTGINPGQALTLAAENLDSESLLKIEIYLMFERMRVGVPEDRSVGSFAEDVNHPEIELFVQAFLLNRKLGGNLSDALERLAKQVRKRQFFRQSARAAVGMQRGGMKIVLILLLVIQIYMHFMLPEHMGRFLTSNLGQNVLQVVIIIVLISFYWMAQVTKIRT